MDESEDNQKEIGGGNGPNEVHVIQEVGRPPGTHGYYSCLECKGAKQEGKATRCESVHCYSQH